MKQTEATWICFFVLLRERYS